MPVPKVPNGKTDGTFGIFSTLGTSDGPLDHGLSRIYCYASPSLVNLSMHSADFDEEAQGHFLSFAMERELATASEEM